MNNLEKSKKIDEILDRGVIVEVLPSREEFKQRLLNDALTFYIGADPTNVSLHLSHAKNFMLLEEFRKLGHKVKVLFGDLTACIGDPSDRESARAKLTREQVKEFSKDWIKNISSIINFEDEENPAEVVFNSTWHDKLSVTDLLELMSATTVQRLLERDMFQKRMSENKPIHLNEFVYPIFQAFDSVALDTDVELCGTDQKFNALMGRAFLKKFKNKEKFVICVNLMENPKTGELMSKSRGFGVFLNNDAKGMFGEIMQQPDEMIEVMLINNTKVSKQEIEDLNIKDKPRDAKIFTASRIVEIFFGKDAADEAKNHFIETFSKQTFPEDSVVIKADNQELSVFEIAKLCLPEKSNGEIRRLIVQNAVAIDGEKKTHEKELIKINDLQVKIGKLGFFKLVKG